MWYAAISQTPLSLWLPWPADADAVAQLPKISGSKLLLQLRASLSHPRTRALSSLYCHQLFDVHHSAEASAYRSWSFRLPYIPSHGLDKFIRLSHDTNRRFYAHRSMSYHCPRLMSRNHLLVSPRVHLQLRHARICPLRSRFNASTFGSAECHVLSAWRGIHSPSAWHRVADLEVACVAATRQLACPLPPREDAEQQPKQCRCAGTSTDANANLGGKGETHLRCGV